MKRILVVLVCLAFFGLAWGLEVTQQVDIINSTSDQTITFNYANSSWGLTSVRVILYMTVTGGYIAADNDSDTDPSTVTLDLGALFDLKDGGVAPRLFNAATVDIWEGDVTETFNDNLTANVGSEGGAGHPDFDPSPTDGVTHSGSNPTMTKDAFIGSLWIAGYEGSGTFSWTLDKDAINNVAQSGGQVDGQFSAVDLGGYVRIIYDYELPVVLSSFTAVYLNGTPQLQWETQSETNNLGWNIYRNTVNDQESWMQINGVLEPGAGTTSEPTQYLFNDEVNVIPNETYFYWIESISYDSESDVFDPVVLTIPEEGFDPGNPEIFEVAKLYNYPNPFNPDTEIFFEIDANVSGNLSIFDINGNLINSLGMGSPHANGYSWHWDSTDELGRKVPSGIYLYVLKTEGQTYAKKMVLTK
jgi:hypothetical protein